MSATTRPLLQVVERSVYGRTNYYATGPLAEPLRMLTGKKTLDAVDMNALQLLGFKVELVTTHIELYRT